MNSPDKPQNEETESLEQLLVAVRQKRVHRNRVRFGAVALTLCVLGISLVLGPKLSLQNPTEIASLSNSSVPEVAQDEITILDGTDAVISHVSEDVGVIVIGDEAEGQRLLVFDHADKMAVAR